MGVGNSAATSSTGGVNGGSVLDLLGGGRERQRQIDERLARLEASFEAGDGLDTRLRTIETNVQTLMARGSKKKFFFAVANFRFFAVSPTRGKFRRRSATATNGNKKVASF